MNGRPCDRGLAEWLAAHQRRSTNPTTAAALLKIHHPTDLRSLLPTIAASTLILHRREDDPLPVKQTGNRL